MSAQIIRTCFINKRVRCNCYFFSCDSFSKIIAVSLNANLYQISKSVQVYGVPIFENRSANTVTIEFRPQTRK